MLVCWSRLPYGSLTVDGCPVCFNLGATCLQTCAYLLVFPVKSSCLMISGVKSPESENLISQEPGKNKAPLIFIPSPFRRPGRHGNRSSAGGPSSSFLPRASSGAEIPSSPDGRLIPITLMSGCSQSCGCHGDTKRSKRSRL